LHGAAPFARSPAEFGKLIADDIEKWGKVVKIAGIKPQQARPQTVNIP
jgi:tripartite-type tricarboxylate transporter receptor subunit TctC